MPSWKTTSMSSCCGPASSSRTPRLVSLRSLLDDDEGGGHNVLMLLMLMIFAEVYSVAVSDGGGTDVRHDVSSPTHQVALAPAGSVGPRSAGVILVYSFSDLL